MNSVKSITCLLAVVCGLCAPLRATVSVEVVFEQDQYLANEPLVLGVRVTNFSGRTLKLGEDEDWLILGVQADSGGVVPKFAEPPVKGAFELPNASRATRKVDVTQGFDLSKPGSYRVQATVRVPELGIEVTSDSSKVNIGVGVKLWEQEYGLPPTDPSAQSVGEVRRYELIQASNLKQVKLYARAADHDGSRVFRVFPLGTMLTFSRPEPLIDRQCRLHVLFQVGARTYSYHVISPDGEVLMRQVYQYGDRRPELRVNEAGNVRVFGGVRLRQATDLPFEETSDEPVRGIDDQAGSKAKTDEAVPTPPAPRPESGGTGPQ